MDYRLVNEEVLRNFLSELGITEYKFNGKTPLDGSMTVELVPFEKKRSGAQNRLWHMWLNDINKEVGGGKKQFKEMRDRMKRKYIGTREVTIDDEVFQELKSTTEASKEEFTVLINATNALAQMLHIKLRQPSWFGYYMEE